MRQLLLCLDTGETKLVEAPSPSVKPNHLLIRTGASLVSAGTERMLVEFGKASHVGKARRQPEKVRQLWDKVRTDGLVPAVEAVRAKLARPVPLGYCNAGVVLEVGEGVRGFSAGGFVASNGPHAEVVCVPARLCARIPDGLAAQADDTAGPFEKAAFTVIGSVALQAVRLARPCLGEVFAVTGLGLVGQLIVQILRAHGCTVLGIDPDPARTALAERFGADVVSLRRCQDPLAAAMQLTDNRGVDGVLIAAATASSVPVHQAAQMCRTQGRIVLVGTAGLRLAREDFYRKELSFQVSCSYGPGRYDPDYEEKGRDYPYGFVRWTAQRNLEAVLELIKDGRLDVGPLISRRVPLDEAPGLYERLASGESDIGTILTYPEKTHIAQRTMVLSPLSSGTEGGARAVVAVIGAGDHATRTILPLLKRAKARRKIIVSRGGTDAAVAGAKCGFERAASDVDEVFGDPEVNVLFVLTPHGSHAELVCRALACGKNVFVEKPLAITQKQLEQVEDAYRAAGAKPEGPPLLHVGFNRRFARHVRLVKELLDSEPAPKSLMMVVNAGRADPGHWVHDPDLGGGRLIGEACHFIDLLRFLVGYPVQDVDCTCTGEPAERSVSVALSFADGSMGTVHYWTAGSRAYPKERLEAFAGGKVLVLDNFRRLKAYGWPGFRGARFQWRRDKGHAAQVREFLRLVESGGPALIPFEELVEVSQVCLDADGRIRAASGRNRRS